jgi:ribonuclease HI
MSDLFPETVDKKYVAYIDGACRGNPGPAAAAAVLMVDDTVVAEKGVFLGHATNNRAEYEGLLQALALAEQFGARVLTVRTDSQLIARQIKGTYRVKNPDLVPLYQKAKEIARRFAKFSMQEIPREQNNHADGICNRVLDEHKT